MLRFLFGEEARIPEPAFQEAMDKIGRFNHLLQRKLEKHRDPLHKYRRLIIWGRSFQRSLDELEQSVYCARQFASKVKQTYADDMDSEELDDYHRYIYFYKNAIIRVFSTLDKAGQFMNDLMDLHTQRVKPKFSYFTVLRQLQKLGSHNRLEEGLSQLKNQFQLPLNKLRNQRNMEIHLMNQEMLDDLMRSHLVEEKSPLENIQENMEDLEACYRMVVGSLHHIFFYSIGYVK